MLQFALLWPFLCASALSTEYLVTTYAGGLGTSGSANGYSTYARFNFPQAVVVDNSFNAYISDTASNLIRLLSFTSGIVTTLAGDGNPGKVNGLSTYASFSAP